MENYLPANFFIRVHKSFIVARHMIKMIHKNKIEIGDITIPIGRSYKEAVEQYTRAKTPARKD